MVKRLTKVWRVVLESFLTPAGHARSILYLPFYHLSHFYKLCIFLFNPLLKCLFFIWKILSWARLTNSTPSLINHCSFACEIFAVVDFSISSKQSSPFNERVSDGKSPVMDFFLTFTFTYRFQFLLFKFYRNMHNLVGHMMKNF